MSLKKLQEKCKKIGRIRLPYIVPNRFALPSTTTKKINSHQKKESCPFLYDYKCQDLEFQFLNPRYVEFEYIVR